MIKLDKTIKDILTILLDSLLAAVLALPRDLRTEKAAATCLKASVSGPPPAMSNSCLNIANYQCFTSLTPQSSPEQHHAGVCFA